MSKREYIVNPPPSDVTNEEVITPDDGNYVTMTDLGEIGEKTKRHSLQLKSQKNGKSIALDDGLYVTVSDDKREHVTRAKRPSIRPSTGKNDDVPTAIDFDLEFDLEDDEDWDSNEYESIDNYDDDHWTVVGVVIRFLQKLIFNTYAILQRWTKNYFLTIVFLAGYLAYFIGAMIYEFGDEGSLRLLVCTILGVIIYTRQYMSNGAKWLSRRLIGDAGLSSRSLKKIKIIRKILRWLMYLALASVCVWVLVEEGMEDIGNLRGLPGLFIFLFICLLFSTDPSRINWHSIVWGLGLQFVMAVCTLRYSFGKDALLWVQDRFDEFFANTKGASLIMFGDNYQDHQMIFGALPLAFFLSGVLTLLYYLGAMQLVVKVLGLILSFVMETHTIESFSIAGGIFLEGFIAVISLRPFLARQSKSQLFTILTSTFTSLGGATLAILSGVGVPLSNIIPAMLISAPATVAVCKLLVPDTRPKDSKLNRLDNIRGEDQTQYTNSLDAFQSGAMIGLPLVGNVIATAFALISMMSWASGTVEWFGDRIGLRGFNLEYILSYLLYPVALAMGVEPSDCRNAGKLLGYRFISSNFIAFLEMMSMKRNKFIFDQYMTATNMTGPYSYDDTDIILHGMGDMRLRNGFISDRSEAIVTYSLCGFSGLFSLGLTVASFYTLLPKRRAWLAKIAIPAIVAGNIANCMTGCFASLFY